MVARIAQPGAGDALGVSEIYLKHRPQAGRRATLRRLLKWYADLVICPRIQRHISPASLGARRIYAAQCVIGCAIANGSRIALDLAQMAKSAPLELPFNFTALDAWRIELDMQQTRAKAGK